VLFKQRSFLWSSSRPPHVLRVRFSRLGWFMDRYRSVACNILLMLEPPFFLKDLQRRLSGEMSNESVPAAGSCRASLRPSVMNLSIHIELHYFFACVRMIETSPFRSMLLLPPAILRQCPEDLKKSRGGFSHYSPSFSPSSFFIKSRLVSTGSERISLYVGGEQFPLDSQHAYVPR